MIDNQKLGEHIRKLRCRKKLTQIELAEAAGMSQTAISLIESGKSSLVSIHNLHSIAVVLSIGIDKLLFT